MRSQSVTAAVGAVIFLFMTNIPPSGAANSVLVRDMSVSLDGSTLTVKTRDGATIAVALKDGCKLTGLARATPDDFKSGDFVGMAFVPTAVGGEGAVEVLMFPEALKRSGEGAYPWDLRPQSTMTNATVSYSVNDIDGRTLIVSYHGQERKIVIADGTPVVTFAPPTLADPTARESRMSIGVLR